MRRKPVAVAVAALDPVVAMLGYNEFAMRSERNDEVRAQAAQAARQASSEVERIVEGLHSLLISVRFMPAAGPRPRRLERIPQVGCIQRPERKT